MDKHIVYSAIIKANEQANIELFGHQDRTMEDKFDHLVDAQDLLIYDARCRDCNIDLMLALGFKRREVFERVWAPYHK